jgi:hypothetical protein
MSKSAVLTAILLAAGGLAPAAGPAKAGVTREQLDKAIAQLGDNAGIWAKGKNIPTKDLADLDSLGFDKQSAPVIMTALSGINRDTEGLYVTARLLERLSGCDLETIRAVMPEVQRTILAAKGFYRPFAPYKATDYATGLPKYDPRMTTADIMAHMSSADLQREAKKQRDLVVAKQNEAAWDTEKAAYKLLAAGGDQNDDAKAMAAMNLAELAGDGTFTIIIDAYQAAAPKMEPARAAKLYQVLRPTALRLRMQGKKKYAIKGESVLLANAASTTSFIDEGPGPRVLALLNKLVEVAKDKSLAPIRVPTQQEIDDFNRKR